MGIVFIFFYIVYFLCYLCLLLYSFHRLAHIPCVLGVTSCTSSIGIFPSFILRFYFDYFLLVIINCFQIQLCCLVALNYFLCYQFLHTGDLTQLNAVYDAAVAAEEQRSSDNTLRTQLTATKLSRTSLLLTKTQTCVNNGSAVSNNNNNESNNNSSNRNKKSMPKRKAPPVHPKIRYVC
jgi:hypothetical protein